LNVADISSSSKLFSYRKGIGCSHSSRSQFTFKERYYTRRGIVSFFTQHAHVLSIRLFHWLIQEREVKMSRQQTRRQVEGYAFTIRGDAIEDGMQNHPHRGRAILAYSRKSMGATEKRIVDLRTEHGLQDHKIFRSDMLFTGQELGNMEESLAEYFVVGYALRDFSNPTNAKSHKRVGTQEPEHFERWNPEEPPILVVGEVLDQPLEHCQLWALLNATNGLYWPFQINQEKVYYVHEFRDDSTNLRARRVNWNKLVIQRSVVLSAQAVKRKQKEEPPARNPTAIDLATKQLITAHLPTIIDNLEIAPDHIYLPTDEAVQTPPSPLPINPPLLFRSANSMKQKEMSPARKTAQIITKTEQLVKRTPTIIDSSSSDNSRNENEHPGLDTVQVQNDSSITYLFLSASTITAEVAFKISKALQCASPPMLYVDTSNIQLLHTGLQNYTRKSGERLPERLLSAFLADGLRVMHLADVEDSWSDYVPDAVRIVAEVMGRVKGRGSWSWGGGAVAAVGEN
jgi:hypothetical protein